MAYLQGQILIASSRLLDPNFVHAVVLMVHHDENGALGLILNRPLETTVREACEKVVEVDCQIDDVLHLGGPCDGPLMALHTRASAGQAQVLPGIYFSTERASIESLLEDGHKPSKFFVGHSGWAGGQLEAEMETGSWLTAPASPDYVFGQGIDELWPRLMTQITVGKWVDPEHMPEDPSAN